MKTKKNIWLGFHNKTRNERIGILKENNFLNDKFSEILENNITLPCDIAEKMSENSIGTLALPLGVAPNFLINGEEYVVPMVTEEPSVIAACSYAAKMISSSGGFHAEVINRKMTGQVILYNIENMEKASENIMNSKEKILNIADEAYPSIVARGGGAENIRIEIFSENEVSFLSVYLTADVKEAMGANIINSMLEGIKPILEEITGGTPLMAILSNYADNSLVTSSCEINVKFLSNDIKAAINTAKKIEVASKFAKIDIYRAATHNKGIFNGIDAVVIATGNDWRAIEAGGHAYAASTGKYKGLTTWTFNEETLKLKGELTLPMPIASVGGSIGLNPTVKAAFNILKNPDAKTLACIIVSVGLAQNLAALKALVTTGIQKGHMKLQAKSLALSAGATGTEVETVVQKLTEIKHMNLENAKKILEKIRK
ncbi:MAG: hydroxymethylglutaryl-CoA reductase, degradative [Leptotrichiaceae bacterium]|nr:hydroxymethylglutaryl-CoA reductase, degradative [Leptotrichiaceae bacterium]